MAKPKSVFICRECGQEYPKWNGKCTACGAWNTIEEALPVSTTVAGKIAAPVGELKYSRIGEISYSDETRYDTGISELNRVLGGGLVKGSLVLIGGDPGIGKSTLLLQICGHMGREHTILYVSGEESERQIKLRAERLGVNSDNLFLASGNNCESIIHAVVKDKPEVVIIDSIQTITSSALNSSAGSIVQVRECTNAFMRMAKSEEIPVFIVSHVNKDGGIAGPKIMEHIVDTVLYFEGEKQLSYRILRAIKNRFGSTNEIGVFNMDDDGLREVKNPSEMMLSGRLRSVSGSAVVCSIEGTRPILAEVQALVTKSSFSAPRRVANGFDYNRLYMLLAVLEKRTGFCFGSVDVYVNIVGGLRIDEPAADLAVAMALYSGLTDKPIPEKLTVFGEVGLGGEIRSVSHVRERVKESARLGFEKCIIPRQSFGSLSGKEDYGIRIIGANTLEQAFRALNPKQSEGAENDR
ncbi:MAG: DNA repair protein RadA [Oscillospiraceae bacterium]|nr:DNA repair protein RadA [Oscillospiraceae bacterium]